MSSQPVPIHRPSNNSITNTSNKADILFDAFNYTVGQDQNIRWLSRPNRKLVQEKYSHDTEKFRISFDVENFQPEQIKIYIQNFQLTIAGVYEEHSEGRFTQKQFEKSFDVPHNADVEAMASYITPNNMLVVEIPLNPNLRRLSKQMDLLNINNDLNNQRRLSFSLNKFNTLNDQGLLSTSNNLSSLAPQGQQLRRTSVTKTTTTTTSTGSTPLSPEVEQLLRNADLTTGTTQAYNTRVTERRASNTGNQQITVSESKPSSTITSTNSKLSNLNDLPIEIPPELLASGGTITIQKRKVSVTKTTDPNVNYSNQVPIASIENTNSTSSTNKQASLTTTKNTSVNSQLPPPASSERRASQTLSTSNQRKTFTLEEFLQNKVWNPSLVNGPNGKKTLYMRLEMKPGTKADQVKITLNGYDLRVEVHNILSTNGSQTINEQSYRQITLFPTCEVEHLTTDFKSDGFLHIQVPIKL